MNKPIRMCINCKRKYSQKDLLRLQCIGRELMLYTKKGRSFYLCDDCLNLKQDIKRLQKSLSNRCKGMVKLTDLESLING
jgi:predicted RNA-binding protein YlxR (DUF448 family)